LVFSGTAFGTAVANVARYGVTGETAAANSQRVVPSELRRMRPEGADFKNIFSNVRKQQKQT
jgi:hypothetical protein